MEVSGNMLLRIFEGSGEEKLPRFTSGFTACIFNESLYLLFLLLYFSFPPNRKKKSGEREFKMLKFGTNVDLSDDKK